MKAPESWLSTRRRVRSPPVSREDVIAGERCHSEERRAADRPRKNARYVAIPRFARQEASSLDELTG